MKRVLISRGGEDWRAGFAFVHETVLTAAHCLSGASEGDRIKVRLDGAPNDVFGKVHEIRKPSDLAVVHVPGLEATDVNRYLRVAEYGTPWWSPGRPEAGDPLLSGDVTNQIDDFQLDAGDRASVLQLRHQPNLENYNGYSGSPIRAGTQANDEGLLGILLQEMPKRVVRPDGSSPASGFLIAATLHWVMGALKTFDPQSTAYSLVGQTGASLSFPMSSIVGRFPEGSEVSGAIRSLFVSLSNLVTNESKTDEDIVEMVHQINCLLLRDSYRDL